MNSVEKNQAIGLLIITGILLAYFTFFSNSGEQPTPVATTPIQAPVPQLQPELVFSTSKYTEDSATAYKQGTEANFSVENDDVKIFFSTKGARIKTVQLKDYQTYKKKPLFILDSTRNHTDWILYTQSNTYKTSDFLFTPTISETDTGTHVAFNLGENALVVRYFLPKSGYQVYQTIEKVPEFLSDKVSAQLYWWSPLPHNEKDLTLSRTTSTITYYDTDGNYHALNETSTDPQSDSLGKPIQWVGFKQKFFTAAVIANGAPFASASVHSQIFPADTTTVKVMKASLPTTADLSSGLQVRWYFGPNKLNIVKGIAPGFEENVYLGWPVINSINRYTIAPLFAFLEKFISNYGIIIICLVLIIKAVLFPLSFQAYKSMAKIKVLKPELDEIKAKAGDDMTLMQQEQMKLYQQVGVNPLSGCVPVLLQMPVLLAMFNFFPNAIELRQQSFWWAEDLSTFDSVLDLPFKIPVYGDHVSLFALLMTASTILYTWYNNQVNVSATGPMVAMSYIMPIVFLFVLNSMPAGLSFYYFVSNLVTVGQQFVIKMFVDEKAIRAKLEANKANAANRKPNRFQQRLMAAMEQQQELKKQQQAKSLKSKK